MPPISEDEAAATGRLWDNLNVFMEPAPMAVWFGNLAFEEARVRHWILIWARGLYQYQFDTRPKLAQLQAQNADLQRRLNARAA